jgi:hypothetical protein
MTSPAAMRLTRTGGRRRIAIARVYANGKHDNRKERGMPSRTADAEVLDAADAQRLQIAFELIGDPPLPQQL